MPEECGKEDVTGESSRFVNDHQGAAQLFETPSFGRGPKPMLCEREASKEEVTGKSSCYSLVGL